MSKSRIIGLLILTAYLAIFSSLTSNPSLVSFLDLLTGILVITMAVVVYKLFRSKLRLLTNLYFFVKSIDGLSLVLAGFFVLTTGDVTNPLREAIWKYNVLLFSSGFLLFTYLLYKTNVVPKIISIWGIAGSALMFSGNLINLTSSALPVPEYFYQLPVIINELFLALWLIVKGFDKKEFEMG